MKTYYLFLCVILLTITQGWTQDRQQEVSSKINKVVVFLNGAEINRSSQFQLPKGRTDIKIQNLSTEIHTKSIQASISGNARILSITSKRNFISPHQNIKKVQVLKDSLLLIQKKLKRLDAQLDDIDEQRSMIVKNKTRLGEKGSVTVTQLESAYVFFEKRLAQTLDKRFSTEEKIDQLEITQKRIKQQLRANNTLKDKPNNIVMIKVDNPTTQQVSLDFSYIVAKAGWAPKYNIRAEGVDKPITFEYMANVFNNTAIDWKDMTLELSTGDPFKSLTIPTLNVWSLKYEQYGYGQGYLQQSKNSEGRLSDTRARANTYDDDSFYEIEEEEIEVSSPSDIEISEVAVNFKIKDKYTVPADNQAYLVDVSTHNLPASYKYYAIPKLDYEAFLMANITNWEKVNIIDNYANIYYNGKYVGESYINTSAANDTLPISMGRDSKIIINRAKKEDSNKKKFIGLKRTESFEYEISVRNTYNVPIFIKIIDQVPVSQESDIEVDVKEISGAEQDPQSGRLTWVYTIKPSETKKVKTTFSVKYPRNKKVKIRKNRNVTPPPSQFW